MENYDYKSAITTLRNGGSVREGTELFAMGDGYVNEPVYIGECRGIDRDKMLIRCGDDWKPLEDVFLRRRI